MKKKNSYLVDDEIDLYDLIKSLWREKILILSISIIFGLVGYLYASFQHQEFKSEIRLKKPPSELFDSYSNGLYQENKIITEKFIYYFKINILSLDNLESFVEESRQLDNFKKYLKSKNISVRQYFRDNFYEASKKETMDNLIDENKFILVFTKELDGDLLLNNYVNFIKKKTVLEFKKNLKLAIENKIIMFENALESAKLINLESPLQKSESIASQDLFYKGTKILSQEIINLKKLLIKLENDQFNYEIISQKPLNNSVKEMLNLKYSATGIIFGLFLSLIIIFLRINN